LQSDLSDRKIARKLYLNKQQVLAMIDRILATGRTFLGNLRATAQQFNKSDGWAMSSHVALSLMMSIFPFLIFAASLAGFLGNEIRWRDIVDLVFEYWPEKAAEPITREIDVVLTKGHAGFLTVGIGLALLFASNGVEAVRVALNRAYQEHDQRSFWKQRLQSLLFVVVGSLLLLAVSVLLVFAPLYVSFIEHASPTIYDRFFGSGSLRLSATLILLVFVVYACHCWLPVRRRRFRQIWPGIALTLVLWTIAARFFSEYLQLFADYSATYAGLAGIMTAQIFLYLMAVILILGAEYNAARERANLVRSVE